MTDNSVAIKPLKITRVSSLVDTITYTFCLHPFKYPRIGNECPCDSNDKFEDAFSAARTFSYRQNIVYDDDFEPSEITRKIRCLMKIWKEAKTGIEMLTLPSCRQFRSA